MQKNKSKKERFLNFIECRAKQIETWATLFGGISSLGFSILSLCNLQESYSHNSFLSVKQLLLYGVPIICGILSLVLLLRLVYNIKKNEKDLNYYTESKRISAALLYAVKRTSCTKANSILRATYGTVPEWHPIDYCKNVLVYDIHEHLRDICIQIKELIVGLYPTEFNDDMVTVDMVFEYPSDSEFIENKRMEFKVKKTRKGTHLYNGLRRFITCAIDQSILQNLKKDEIMDKKEEGATSGDHGKCAKKCKVITSGDRTASNVIIHDYFENPKSFYSHLQKQGYVFCNDKSELEKENHYIWSNKDNEYGRVGSIIGLIIELKNDNPEKVFVRTYLTITTYGRRLAEEKDLLDDKTYEKLFKETVINCFKSIIEAELAQMFIRHGINNGFINRHNGRLRDE